MTPAVLYVEDDPRSAKIMRLMLTNQQGFKHVSIFEDSANFLQRVLALNPPPDVIFLDIHVKPYDGFEMLEMLRQQEQFANIPIVALTASVMNEEVERLKTIGFNGCIAKPIDVDVFPMMLNRILAGEEIWRIMG